MATERQGRQRKTLNASVTGRAALPTASTAASGNLPSGHAIKPSDILRAKTGATSRVLNTEAESRLVHAGCLAHAVDQSAD